MKHWRIFTMQGAEEPGGSDGYFDQAAATLRIDGGALVFMDAEGDLLLAVGAGHWATVEPISEEDSEAETEVGG